MKRKEKNEGFKYKVLLLFKVKISKLSRVNFGLLIYRMLFFFICLGVFFGTVFLFFYRSFFVIYFFLGNSNVCSILRIVIIVLWDGVNNILIF